MSLPPAERSSPSDAEDQAATVPAKGWNEAATIPAVRGASGSAVNDGKTLPMDLNRKDLPQHVPASGDAPTLPTTVPSGEAPTRVTDAFDDPAAPTLLGGESSTAARGNSALTNQSQSGSYSRSLSRTGRTRINLNLPAEAQQLDEKLQLSRSSVLADMATARFGRGDLPKGISKLIDEQGTGGRYAVNKPLAAGGMGAVLQIEDHDFRRGAAMKIIKAQFADNQEALERFLAEAQVTAQLEHPNIVPIHDLGVMDDGTLYFTMKLIEGMSLGKLVKLLQQQAGTLKDKEGNLVAPDAESAGTAAKWTEEEKLLTFLKVLDGVGFAHSRGVVHRDIKPDNIMLGAHGEVLVVDWGIAKVLGTADQAHELVRQVQSIRDADSLSATMEGAAMGTIFYMPPEQATGRLDLIDGRADIYALGATLYELLALRRCLDHGLLPDLIARIASGNFVPLDRAAPHVNADLVAVVHRAMATDRDRRYATCAEFSDDLRRYLAGQAVRARRRNLIERLGLWYAKHRRQVLAGTTAAVLMVGAVGATVWWQRQIRRREADVLITQGRSDYDLARQQGSLEVADRALASLTKAEALLPDDIALRKLQDEVSDVVKALKAQREAKILERAAFDKANQLLAEGISLKSQDKLDDAEKTFSAAYRLAPGNAAIEEGLKEVVRLRGDQRRRLLHNEAQNSRQQGDQLMEQAKAKDPADPTIPDLLRRAEAAYALTEKDGVVVEGTQEQVRIVALVRVRAEQARKAADDRQKGQAAGVRAQQALAAKQFVPAKEAIAQALGFIPGDAAALQLRDQILTAERTDSEARAAADRVAKCRDLVTQAKAAAAKGDLKVARDLVAQAWGFVPGDPEADALRVELAERERQAARDAQLAAARTKADAALAEAKAQLAKHQAELARYRAANAQFDKLARDGAAIDAKGQAHREAQSAHAAMSEHWSLTEAAAQNVLGFLADQPAVPVYAEARRMLADLYQLRLSDARSRRDIANIAAFATLLQRYDDGRYAALLKDLSKLTLTGPAGAVIAIHVLGEGPDLRLVPVGDALSVTLPVKELDLKGGRYQLTAGDVMISIVVSAGVPVAVNWPDKLPVITGMSLRYVPANGAQKAFLLGMTEITHSHFAQFVLDPPVFAQVKATWKKVYAQGPEAGDPLSLIPRQSFNRGEHWQAKASDSEGRELTELTVPEVLKPLPVHGISRFDAEAYCAWLAQKTGLKVRLPTLAEWQFAANAGDERRQYPWGEFFDDALTASAVLPGNPGDPPAKRRAQAPAGASTTDIGPFGHRDLAGNMREWVADRSGVHGGMVAGGGYGDDRPELFRTTAFESAEPDYTGPVIGFRILVELP